MLELDHSLAPIVPPKVRMVVVDMRRAYGAEVRPALEHVATP